MNTEVHCPHCASQKVQKLSVAHELDLLPERLKPPKMKPGTEANVYLTIGLITLAMGVIVVADLFFLGYIRFISPAMMAFVIVGLLVLPLGPVLTLSSLALKRGARKSNSVARRNSQLWASQWLCFECGEIFEVGQDGSVTNARDIEISTYDPWRIRSITWLIICILYVLMFFIFILWP